MREVVKTASKSVHPFGWNFFHKNFRTHRQTDTHTDTQTNCSENIIPPRFRGGVTKGAMIPEALEAERKLSGKKIFFKKDVYICNMDGIYHTNRSISGKEKLFVY